MRKVTLLPMLFLLSSCANTQNQHSEYISSLQVVDIPELGEPSLPDLPKGTLKTIDGKSYVVFDTVGMQKLLHFREVATFNTEVLSEALNALKSITEERNAIINTLKAQETATPVTCFSF